MKNNSVFKLSSPDVCIVEASAGSGKTYALSKRYLQLLITSEPEINLKHILAITFTNKAAREMQQRILEFLKKIALDVFANAQEKEDILSSLNVTREFARKKAYQILEYLLRNYNFFQVQTIDSFMNSLIIGCAFKLNLSSSPKIKHNYQQYLAYSLDELIEQAVEDPHIRKIFDQFLTQYLIVENKKSWFPKKDILKLISVLTNKRNVFGKEFSKFAFSGENLHLKKMRVLELIRGLKDNLPEGTKLVLIKKLNKFVEANKSNFNLKEFFSAETLTKTEFPIKKKYQVPLEIQKLWEEIRRRVTEICELEAFSFSNCYIDIFSLVFDNFKELALKDEIIFLEELSRYVQRIFHIEFTTIAELYYRLATRLEHYLIDEFQDTNVLQWNNLKVMVEEALSTGGTLFCVGDRKQAIYRFRGGNPALFDRVKADYFKYNLQNAQLSKNYRSQKEIVLFNNLIFSKKNFYRFFSQLQQANASSAKELSCAEVDEIIELFSGAQQDYIEQKYNGYVSLEMIKLNGATRLDIEQPLQERIINRIKELKQRFSYYDIAILSRKSAEVELITGWLIDAGIPVESEKTLNLKGNACIKEIISLLKFLNCPMDSLSFAGFILSDIFCAQTGAALQEIRDFIFGLDESCRKIYLYRKFRNSFPSLWADYLEEFFNSVGIIPLYELVVSIFNRFSVFKNFPQFQGFFLGFLELIKEQEEEYTALALFLDFFEKAEKEFLYVYVADTNAIKILTVHKAKGLEFPVVIIPFLTLNPDSGPANSENVFCVPEEGDKLSIVRLRSYYTLFSSKIKNIYQCQYKESLIDELNNIYVALTRAEKELYLYISESKPSTRNLASMLMPCENFQAGEQVKYLQKPDLERNVIMHIPASDNQDWIYFLKNEFVADSGSVNQERVLKGTIIHYALALLGNLLNQDVDEILEKAISLTKLRFPDYLFFQEISTAIAKLLKDEVCRQFFFVEHGLIFQEKEIVTQFGRSLRLDRMIVKDRVVFVVDYKLSVENLKEYNQQVKKYMQAAAQLYPDKQIKGFLVFIQGCIVQEVEFYTQP
ncbi:MAG: hypothetical protein DRP78_04755 [Candidatus Omnitrophota bacterium]|nr:MAG: hypothetical protein DRP78_04755 [Candidatus Omnitrophota bacterium]